MRIPITKYGLPQVVIYPGLCILIMAAFTAGAVKIPALWIVVAIFGIILIWALSFFRDPKREISTNEKLLLSPADGTVSDIEEVDEPHFIGGKAKRIGIFLSVFNVHINRTPCKVRIESITYRPGKFINAMNKNCGKVNESNDIAMTRLSVPNEKLLVRQISGAIARRIVCDAERGQEFTGGAIFGMIKFGSRTELYLPAESSAKIKVKIGDKVNAGITVLAQYE
ncbi:MAG: phosphatidylserine decarboxylase family protein [Phycisphaerae bacterium]